MVRPIALRTVLTGAAALLVLVALPVEAQWKWKDKSGHVQYSDLPPPAGTPDQDILARPMAQKRSASSPFATASAAASAQPTGAASSPLVPRTVDPELDARRKKAEGEQAAKNKVEEDRIAAVRADNCARARSQLRTLDSGIRVTRTNDKGEREFLDDQQRADETNHAKDAIAADCR